MILIGDVPLNSCRDSTSGRCFSMQNTLSFSHSDQIDIIHGFADRGLIDQVGSDVSKLSRRRKSHECRQWVDRSRWRSGDSGRGSASISPLAVQVPDGTSPIWDPTRLTLVMSGADRNSFPRSQAQMFESYPMEPSRWDEFNGHHRPALPRFHPLRIGVTRTNVVSFSFQPS
jgi:hypothetical protein